MLALIKRTFSYHAHMDKEIFLNLYKTMVRPHMEYSSCIWSPYYKKDIEILESVQRQATIKLLPSFSNLSYPERLRELGLPTLLYRRIRYDMVQLFRLLHHHDHINHIESCEYCWRKSDQRSLSKLGKKHGVDVCYRSTAFSIEQLTNGMVYLRMWLILLQSICSSPV